ncbi:MAG TPA: SAM-dependent methyltransferase [Opitutus sp.]|nr:SAM-dependent methyltransferase [Opitutus sp.]
MITPPGASAEFLAAFRAKAAGADTLRFDEFMELALYDRSVGYYRRDRNRVGYGPETDFFTASTSGPIFGELVSAAAASLLGEEQARGFTFVEIGAEPDRSVLADVAHPFRAVRTVRLGDPLVLSGPSVVFSNELFDAQPFRRFVFRRDAWRELGVTLHGGTLTEIEFTTETPDVLPPAAAEGYVIDAPLRAIELVEQIASAPWSGLFLALDYGKSWRELTEACPAGTARAYRRHRQSNDLLAHPGEQDLTCHVCWDWLEQALRRHGFASPTLESQETFFIRRAGRFIAATAEAEAARFSQRKLALMQLLHPTHLGQKFQVLHAVRA